MNPAEPPAVSNPEDLEPKGRILRSYAVTSALCVLITLVLKVLGVSSLDSGAVVSFSIGLSIQSCFVLFRRRIEPTLGVAMTSALLTITGLLLGLIIAGILAFGDPFFLLIEAPGTVILGIVFGVIGYLVVDTRERLLKSELQLAVLERSRAEQAQQLAVAELQVLQAQIEPHFLFNTLGNIQSLIHDEPDKADAMLSELTVLLRGSFNSSRSGATTLQKELELVRAYLEIQQIRMGERLQFTIDASPECGSTQIPHLLIQPLVENAITHGIEAQAGPGTVRVQATVNDGFLEVSVSDSGPGPEAALQRAAAGRGPKGNGSALDNIRARLNTAYGNSGTLKLFALQPQGARAQLRLPLTSATAAIPEAAA